MTELNTTVDASTTAVAEQAVVKKPKTTVSKADLTVDFVRERLELRTEVFVLATNGEYQPLVEGARILAQLPEGAEVEVAFGDEIPAGATVLSLDNFYWKVKTVASEVGSFAGTRREADNYYSVVLAGTNYSGKQLVHFYKTGNWDVPKLTRSGEAKPKKEAGPREVRAFVPLSPAAKAAAAAQAAAKKKAAAEKAAQKKAAEAGTAPAAESQVQDAAAAPAVDTDDIQLG